MKTIQLPGASEKQVEQVRRMWFIHSNMMVHQIALLVDTKNPQAFLDFLVEQGVAKKRVLAYHKNCPLSDGMNLPIASASSIEAFEFPLHCEECDQDIEREDVYFDSYYLFDKSQEIEWSAS